MSIFKRIIHQIFYSLLFVFILVISLILFITTTTPGLFLSTKFINNFLPAPLEIDGLSGRLADHIHIESLSYQDKNLTLHLKHLEKMF